MPEEVQTKTRRGLTPNQLKTTAEYILEEFTRRKGLRKNLEQLWKEIDRQIAMEPRVREVSSGDKADWYPDLELPLQFNALEVTAADARRLKFPRGTEWYNVSAEISDEYSERWQENRAGQPLVSGAGFTGLEDSPEKELAQQIDLDQETANTLSKVTLDHFHRMYDFRKNIDLFDAEMIKYGTGICRVRPVRMSKFSLDFRGNKADNIIGPAVIPCSIKKTYLDITPHAVLNEGIQFAPLTLREGRQRLDSLLIAGKKGGKERGWMPAEIRKLKPLDRERNVDIIEGEGDFVIPLNRGSLFLPNFLITIAVGQGGPFVVRMRENPTPFHSYVSGVYMAEDTETPYGVSPLMKGMPLQEAATEVFNDLMAAARLSGDPPIIYDRFDQNYSADRGPNLHPGAQLPADSPNSIEALNEWDIQGLTTAYLALVKQYEDLTGANDARRGAPIRSHTTTGGIELEAQRGIARTDDFVQGVEQGPIRTMLYMEWDIIKSVMTSPQKISVASGGIEGWVELKASDLPDNIIFHVNGSAGVFTERERSTNFLQASQFAMQLNQMAAQLQEPFNLDLTQIAIEAYEKAGVQNAARFVGTQSGDAGQPPGQPGLPGADEGVGAVAEDLIAQLVPQQG